MNEEKSVKELWAEWEPTTRAAHMEWCKERALEYVEVDDLVDAVSSMLSDLCKHDETRPLLEDPFNLLHAQARQDAVRGDTERVRNWITGFSE